MRTDNGGPLRTMPSFVFSVSDVRNTVDEKTDLWLRHLPSTRHPGDATCSPVTVGDYFTAARRFLSDNDFAVVKTAALDILDQPIEPLDIAGLSICLVKHGTFYHPSRVDIRLGDERRCALVLNLAVSPAGRACIDRECAALRHLAHRTDALPKVYGKDHLTSGAGVDVSLFAARWLDDYHEFHLSREGRGHNILVWDEGRGHYFLSEEEQDDLYRQAALILTRCYNPLTCEQIQPWHHAAGDFVVNKSGHKLDVKLITVRQYTSLFEEVPDDREALVEAAMIFLVNLSIRMRLDREDGIKETLWADDRCLSPVVAGFLEGLGAQDQSLVDLFKAVVLKTPETQWMDVANMLIQSYHPRSPELPVIQEHLANHMHGLCGVLTSATR